MDDKLFMLLGLGVPFYLGAATYAVFSWLDNNASDEATKVISSWLQGRSQHKPDLGKLIINAFDRIYTSPLLRLRAFRRSVAISISIWLVIFAIPLFISFLTSPWTAADESYQRLLSERYNIGHAYVIAFGTTIINAFVIVMSDYISLFFVREFLQLSRAHPIIASITSSAVGIFAVTTSLAVLLIGLVSITYFFNPNKITSIATDTMNVHDAIEKQALIMKQFFWMMAPALVVHLWLPLFALSSLVVRLVFWIFRAVEWSQWFLKQGDAHPFRAIGVVATIIVFGSAMLTKEAWALL